MSTRFTQLWLGQVASLLGSAMTRFALAIYVWDLTGQATPVVLIGVFASIPALIASLAAGVLVDRWNRKWTLILSDLGSGLATILLLVFLFLGELQLWQIYAAAALGGICNTVQHLAFSASVSLLVEKDHYSRANGMMSLAEYLSIIGAPLLAGILIPLISVRGILVIDVITFLFAVATVAILPIPQPEAQQTESGNFLAQISFGFRYIFQRRSFVGLLALLFMFNSVESMGFPLLAPMILARTGGNESILGTVQAVMGVGGIIGGLLISLWGGPKRRIIGVLLGVICTGLVGDSLMGLGQTILIWIIAGFCLEAFIPLVVSANRAIWQAKVPPALQGRIFATTGFISTLAAPISTVIGGLLADQVFEPAMLPGGWLTPVFSPLVGTGPGAGMAILFVISGVTLGIVGVIAYLTPFIRQLETMIPDHDLLTSHNPTIDHQTMTVDER